MHDCIVDKFYRLEKGDSKILWHNIVQSSVDKYVVLSTQIVQKAVEWTTVAVHISVSRKTEQLSAPVTAATDLRKTNTHA